MKAGWITRPDGKRLRFRPHGLEKKAKNTGICCPNYVKGGDAHCPENSLSTEWMIRFQFELGEKDLSCFQCGEILGVYVPDGVEVE